MEPNHDRRARWAEVHGVVDQLVEQLHDQIRGALDLDRLLGQVGRKLPLRKRVPIRGHRGSDHTHYVKSRALGTGDGLLDPRRRPHRDQNCIQAFAPLTGAVEIHLRALGDAALGLQVLERGAHDGERCADFVSQLPGQGAQIAGVFVEPAQKSGKPSCHVPELIGRCGLRKLRVQALACQRRLTGAAQAREPHGEPSRKHEHQDDRHDRRDERDIEHARQGTVAQSQPALARLGYAQLPYRSRVLAVVDQRGGVNRSVRARIIHEATIQACEDSGFRSQCGRLRKRIRLRQGPPGRRSHS